jgi:hypothetical protein
VGGCTNCGEKAGCDDRKGEMLGAVDVALAALYPTRRWGELDDGARDPVDEQDGAALAEELARELDAAAFFVPGDACDFIYVLALGRTPCLIQVREHGVEAPDTGGVAIREQYLRVALSPLARMAAVQQVALDGNFISSPGSDGDLVIIERPRAGVYDAPLLARLQRLVAVLPAYDLLHVDFGDISAPPEGFDGAAWPYGGERALPAVANYLFSPLPTTMVTTNLVPCSTTR